MRNSGKSELVAIINFLTYTRFLLDIICIAIYATFSFLLQVIKIVVPARSKSLEGEIILITGGANGIGREICYEIASREKNLTIISWDVNKEMNGEIVRQLKDQGVKHAYDFDVDVSDRKQVEAAAKKIREDIGDVTILFNNAGIVCQQREGWNQDPENTEKVFRINLLSHCWMIREFLPNMIKNCKGHIVETCSVLAFGYGSGGASYVASKHAIMGYMESIKEDLRLTLAGRQIRTSIAYPYFTKTGLIDHVVLNKKYEFIHYALDPTEVARKIVTGMLCDEEHIYIPGRLRLLQMLIACLPPAVVRMSTDILGLNQVLPKKTLGALS